MIDEVDRQILSILQQNARTSNAEIARQVSMAPSAVLERIRRLESRGVIQGYEARINPEALGLNVLAFVFVRSTDFDGEAKTVEVLADIPEVLEAHHIAGEDCFLLKVRAKDAKSLGRMLRERIGGTGTVHSTRTTIVLETVRESGRLPLPGVAPAEASLAEEEVEDV
jgi:Lrp/AsnC family leucine-responsive transcriptional regulator